MSELPVEWNIVSEMCKQNTKEITIAITWKSIHILGNCDLFIISLWVSRAYNKTVWGMEGKNPRPTTKAVWKSIWRSTME